MYATAVFHGDLHPANVLLLDDNRVGYVDFGIVGRVPPEVQQSLGDYARSLFGGASASAVEHLLRWLHPSARTDPGAARSHMLGLTDQFLDELEQPGGSRRELVAGGLVAELVERALDVDRVSVDDPHRDGRHRQIAPLVPAV